PTRAQELLDQAGGVREAIEAYRS
ncbi:MAG: hypothetical protein VW912_06805, partial [Flavobacteriaceae bacterium]